MPNGPLRTSFAKLSRSLVLGVHRTTLSPSPPDALCSKRQQRKRSLFFKAHHMSLSLLDAVMMFPWMPQETVWYLVDNVGRLALALPD